MLKVTAPASFNGSSTTITVTATNSQNQTAQQQFTATAVADTQTDPPFLGPVTNQTTTAGTAVNFTLTSTNLETPPVVYKIVDPTSFAAPANVTININQTTGQVTLTPAAGFTGTIHLLAEVRSSTATDTQSSYDTQAFDLTVNAVSTTQPTLGSVANQTTTTGTAVTFTLSSNDPTGAGVVYKIVDPTTFGAPANVTVSITQSTGQVTLTPNAGFTGTVHLLAEVRSSTADDVQASYDTKAFDLTVNAPNTTPSAPTNLVVDTSSNTGTFDGNGYITTSTPKLNVTAPTGGTVQFKLNGVVIGTGTETTSGSGQFTFTVPSGKLATGSNTVTASVTTSGGTSVDSTALTLIYAPNYSSGAYVVPVRPAHRNRLRSPGPRGRPSTTTKSATSSPTRLMVRSAASRRAILVTQRRP